MSKLQIDLVITKDKTYFAKTDRASYNSIDFTKYLIDGEIPSKTFNQYWFAVNKEPELIQRYISQPNINYRYELIDKTMANEKIKPVLIREEVTNYSKEDYVWIWKEEYALYESLYKEASDEQPEKLETIEFEIVNKIICNEVTTFNGFSYPIQRTRYSHEGFINLTEKDVSYEFLDSIMLPDILLPMRPTGLTTEQTYKIIRKHVQDNINPKVSVITSDYDFCFTVKKKIHRYETKSVRYDENDSIFQRRKRKPHFVTAYYDTRDMVIFEMSPKSYQNYTIIEPFKGNNLKELKENIDFYLKELMTEINKPLKDCPHCKGLGVIQELAGKENEKS